MSSQAQRIAVVLTAACLMAVGLSPATTQADPCLSDTFDGYTTGEPPVPPWEEDYIGWGGDPHYTRQEARDLGVEIKIDESIYYGDSGKSVHFLDDSTAVSGHLYREFSAATSVTMDYYMRTDNDSYEGAFVFLYGADREAEFDYAAAFSNGAFTGKAGYIGIHGSPAGWIKNDLLAYQEDTWYYVRRTVDCASDTGSFYVEELYDHDTGEHTEQGDPANTSASYAAGLNKPMDYVQGVWIYSSNSQGADCYIDEIVVNCEGVIPEPFSMAFMGSAFVGVVGWRLRRRRRGAGR